MGILSDSTRTRPNTPAEAARVRQAITPTTVEYAPLHNGAIPPQSMLEQSKRSILRDVGATPVSRPSMASVKNTAQGGIMSRLRGGATPTPSVTPPSVTPPPIEAPPVAAAAAPVADTVDEAAAAAARLRASGIDPTKSLEEMLAAARASTTPTAAATPTPKTVVDPNDPLAGVREAARKALEEHKAAGHIPNSNSPTPNGRINPSALDFNRNDRELVKRRAALVDKLSNTPGHNATVAAMDGARLKPNVTDRFASDMAARAEAKASATNAIKGAGSALGTLAKYASIIGLADTGATVAGDMAQRKFVDTVGQDMGVENPIAKYALAGSVSASDSLDAILGRAANAIGAGAASINPDQGLIQNSVNVGRGALEGLTDPYTTHAQQYRDKAGTVTYSPLSNLFTMAMTGEAPAQFRNVGKLADAAMTPTGLTPVGKDTPQLNTTPQGQANQPDTLDPNQTLRMGNSVYDLRNFTNVGNNIYRDNANPNSFVGVGTRDNNPKPAYSLDTLNEMKAILNYDTRPQRDTDSTTADTIDANREYRTKVASLQNAFNEGRIGPRQLSSGTAEFARIRDARISGSTATNAAMRAVREAMQVEGRNAVKRAAGGNNTNEEGKPLSEKDVLKHSLDVAELGDKRQETQYKHAEAANTAIMDMLDNAAGGTGTPKAQEYRRLYQQLPPTIREAALTDGAAARDAIPKLVGALDRTVKAQNESADATGATLLGGVGGLLTGASASKLTGGLGKAADALIGLKYPAVKNTRVMERLLGNRLVSALAGGGAGALVGSKIGPQASQIPELPVYGQIDPNNPNVKGLQHGKPSFADFLSDPTGSLALQTGDPNTYRTPGGYLTRLSQDDADTLATLQQIMTQNRPR